MASEIIAQRRLSGKRRADVFVRFDHRLKYYVQYTQSYDTYGSLPDLSKISLDFHKKNKRKHLYSREALELDETPTPVRVLPGSASGTTGPGPNGRDSERSSIWPPPALNENAISRGMSKKLTVQ